MKRSLESLFPWRVFLSLSETGSMSRTALEMHLQPSQVSRAVSGLETLAKAQLFERSKRPIVLTQKGREVKARLLPALAEWERFEGFLEEQKEDRPFIRLSTPVGIGRFYLNAQLADYAKVDPRASFGISVEKGAEELLAREADVVFIPYRPESESLRVWPAMDAYTVPLASPAYVLRHGCPEAPEELSAHTGILMAGNHFPAAEFLVRGRERRSAFWKRTFRYSDMLNIKDAVLRGYGIAVDIPLGMVLDEIERKELVPVLGGWHRDCWHYSVVTRAEDTEETPVGKFAAWYADRATREIDERRRRGFELLGITPEKP